MRKIENRANLMSAKFMSELLGEQSEFRVPNMLIMSIVRKSAKNEGANTPFNVIYADGDKAVCVTGAWASKDATDQEIAKADLVLRRAEATDQYPDNAGFVWYLSRTREDADLFEDEEKKD